MVKVTVLELAVLVLLEVLAAAVVQVVDKMREVLLVLDILMFTVAKVAAQTVEVANLAILAEAALDMALVLEVLVVAA